METRLLMLALGCVLCGPAVYCFARFRRQRLRERAQERGLLILDAASDEQVEELRRMWRAADWTKARLETPSSTPTPPTGREN